MSYNCGCSNHSGTELPQGPPGNTGATGPQGPRGYRGFQGNVGATGAAGIGTDDELAAYVATPDTATGAAIAGFIDTAVKPAVSDYLANDPTVAEAAAELAQSDVGLIRSEDERLPHKYTDEESAFRVRDSERRIAFEINDVGETVIGQTATREASPHYPTALRIMDVAGNIAFEVDGDGDIHGIPDTTFRTQLNTDQGASTLTKVGVVIGTGTAGQFDAGMTESPCIGINPATGRQEALYTGYSATDGTAVASHGLAYSNDGVTWTKVGQYFTGSGQTGDPDEMGVTGPVRLFDGNTEHLFYIGLTEVGYEAGDKTLCHASRPIGGTWTRHGAVIEAAGAGWYSVHVWHPNFVQYKGVWYCFFNATGNGGKERMGYATADTLYGPWTVDPEPLLPDAGGYSIESGDGFIWPYAGQPRMEFFRAAADYSTGSDWWATTTWEEFPRGWVVRGESLTPTPGTYDAKFAHKPWITQQQGRVFHYYTAVNASNARTIALAVSGGAL